MDQYTFLKAGFPDKIQNAQGNGDFRKNNREVLSVSMSPILYGADLHINFFHCLPEIKI